jgi:hypothetical protein
MSTGQCDLHHLCVVSSVFLIKFKNNLVLTYKQFRSNTKLHYLRFMRDKQGKKKKKKKKSIKCTIPTLGNRRYEIKYPKSYLSFPTLGKRLDSNRKL